MKFARQCVDYRSWEPACPFSEKLDHTLFIRSEREEPGQRNGQKLDDIVREADEYNYLKAKHFQRTRLEAI